MDKMRSKLEDLKELRDLVRSLGRGGGWGPLRRAPIQYLDMKVLTDATSGASAHFLTVCTTLSGQLPSLRTSCVAVCNGAHAHALNRAVAALVVSCLCRRIVFAEPARERGGSTGFMCVRMTGSCSVTQGRPGLLRTVLEAQETRGLTRSDDISRLLPSEAANMARGRRVRQSKLLFFAKVVPSHDPF